MRYGGTHCGDQDDDTKNKTDPGSGNTEDGLEWNLVKGVTLVSPSLAESDVR